MTIHIDASTINRTWLRGATFVPREAPTPALREYLALLEEQATWGNSRQQAHALRMKMGAIKMVLDERSE